MMHILIVDDEKNIRTSIKEFLSLEGFTSTEAENGLSAQKLLQEEVYDGVIMDLKMPGLTGLELLTWMKKEGPNIPVVMISAFGGRRRCCKRNEARCCRLSRKTV